MHGVRGVARSSAEHVVVVPCAYCCLLLSLGVVGKGIVDQHTFCIAGERTKGENDNFSSFFLTTGLQCKEFFSRSLSGVLVGCSRSSTSSGRGCGLATAALLLDLSDDFVQFI